jgi:vacuolar-type H+-ATPase subunit I/STV1
VLLVIAAVALYGKGLQGAWRRTYAITAVLSFYLLIFVLIAQLFLKVTVLHDMAPTQSEPPFAIAQGIVLAIFLALTVLAARRFGNGVALTRPA